MTQSIDTFFKNFKLTLASIGIGDIVEILILAFLIYKIIAWIKDTRTWVILKGILVVAGFFIIAELFNMSTILYLAKALLDIIVIAIVVVFQPELRSALERIGKNNVVSTFFRGRGNEEKENSFSRDVVDELVRASYELGAAKTGALMVIERQDMLDEYIKTGIMVDGVVTSQLLINIFEHNTPLHDGAVVIRGNRAVAATCYLPLSQNMGISKAYGTRHRAALGVSETSDCVTVIVSEETGYTSVAMEGKLIENISGQQLREILEKLIEEREAVKHFRMPWRKGKSNEKMDS